MKKAFLLIVCVCVAMVAVTTGCTSKKVDGDDSTTTDSTAAEDTDTVDSVDSATEVIAATPMPKAADQLFDDFFFNFIANKKLQMNRIKFPLPVVNGTKTTELTRGNWKMDYFFRKQGYYTLIFDNEKQIKFSKSTDLDSVIVEKIHLKRGTIEQYWFDHQDGSWKLNQIRNITFKDSYNASFYTFLSHFFANGGKGAVKSSLAYSGPDPNGEETNVVNTTIPAEEWSSFLPELPHEMIYNILYGQKYSDTDRRIVTFRGLSNGVETQLIFKQNGKSWRLEKVVAY
ncbi:DUF4348 domain-containing protein [Prevotella melaninogenica]|uniref:DUF4348 domain-containing protein n=1 Tax=Prevotella melaninogenica TaxID=28132 RepID=UPI001BAC6F89|nr:DUF4348 domain-containing protein [Prevotella melaninogenica]QUB66619.1 DUF4348 domain-containing protein [Prevotella melaninogenica]